MQISVAYEVGIGASIVRGWLKEEPKLSLNMKWVLMANDNKLDQASILWFKEQGALRVLL